MARLKDRHLHEFDLGRGARGERLRVGLAFDDEEAILGGSRRSSTPRTSIYGRSS
jgi:hypothetical protein